MPKKLDALDNNFNNFVLGNEGNEIKQRNRTDELADKFTKEIFDTDNKEVKTDLNNRQIVAITKGKIFADAFQSSKMKSLCDFIMVLSYSKDRKSRKEYTSVFTSMLSVPEETDPNGINSRLFGTKG